MAWQMDLSRELMGLHDSLDDHVDRDAAALQLIQLAGSLRASTTLEGEEHEKLPNVGVANAAEFAFIWNTATPEHRENITAVLMARQDEAIKCFQEDHDGLKEELGAASRRIAELTAELATLKPKTVHWHTEYGHDDCETCEDLAELSIAYLQAPGNENVTRRHLPGEDGHWGRAERAS